MSMEASSGGVHLTSRGIAVFVSNGAKLIEINPNKELSGFVSELGDYQDLESAVIAARSSLDTRRDETKLKRDGYSQ